MPISRTSTALEPPGGAAAGRGAREPDIKIDACNAIESAMKIVQRDAAPNREATDEVPVTPACNSGTVATRADSSAQEKAAPGAAPGAANRLNIYSRISCQ